MDPTMTAKTTITLLMCEQNLSEPLDYSAPALDLCVRGKNRSPSPEGASQVNVKREPIYIEAPSSTYCFSSPASHDSSESSSDISDHYSKLPNVPIAQKAKIPRPFKAYPKDPLSLAVGVATAEAIIGQDAAEAYTEFRKRMLSQVQASNAGTNKNMRRVNHNAIISNSDPSYWEKRRKNNEAAKRSRDARRAKEDEIAIRCAFLEQENLKLRYEVATLRSETERLRNLMYN